MFLINSIYIIARGLFWGNLAGLLLCFLQAYFKIIPLDQASYYMSFVPIRLPVLQVLMLNAGTFLVCLAFLVIPGLVISRITPIRAIRFD